MPDADTTLQAIHLYKKYTTRQGNLSAVEDISFSVAPGEFLCIVGPSGCGKTTLLRLLSGLLLPDQGEVFFQEKLLQGPSRSLGIVFQKPNLMPWRTVLDNVLLPLQVQHICPDQAHQQALDALRMVELQQFVDSYPRELSGGMAQRVAIARALAYEPKLLLLDEPFGALDALTRETLNLTLMKVWEASQTTVVMVTHDVHEATFLADRVLVLSQRPGQVSAIIPINLPRPRTSMLFYEDDFNKLAYQVRQSIQA